MEMALDRGDRHHPLVRVAQLQPGLLRADGARLEQQDAGDDLEAVGNPVLHLPKKRLLLRQQPLGLLEQVLLLALDCAPLGNVLERNEDRRAGLVLVADEPRVEQHCASAEVGEIVLDLEIVHRAMLGNDGLDQQAQGRHVPLAVAELEEPASASARRILFEMLVEAAAGGEHAQGVVEHDERLGQCIDDRESQGLGVAEIVELFHEDAPSGGSMSRLSVTAAPRPGR
jgi:hypothetical protein